MLERAVRDPFLLPVQQVAEYAWGAIWTRPGLDRRIRSLPALAYLAALGRHDDFRTHVDSTRIAKEVLDQMSNGGVRP